MAFGVQSWYTSPPPPLWAHTHNIYSFQQFVNTTQSTSAGVPGDGGWEEGGGQGGGGNKTI